MQESGTSLESGAVRRPKTTYKVRYAHGLDEKRRVQIPAKWRSGVDDEPFTILLWKEEGSRLPCILVMPPANYEAMVEKLDEMANGDPKVEALRRYIGSNSEDVTVDKVGRICIPDTVVKAAGIRDSVVLAGLLDRFQIWDPESYQRVSAADDAMSAEIKKMI